MPSSQSEPSDAEWDRISIIVALMGSPFKKRAMFSEEEWRALKGIGELAARKSLDVQWKVPLSRLVPIEGIQDAHRDLWYKAVILAAVIGAPPNPLVRAVLVDSRSPVHERIVNFLTTHRIPYALWHGPDRLTESQSTLESILEGNVTPQRSPMMNRYETAAMENVTRALVEPHWSAFDFIPPRMLREIAGLISGDKTLDRANEPVESTKLWITAETALSAVVSEFDDPKNDYVWYGRKIAEWMSEHRALLHRSSFDLVVFPNGLSDSPLFALEVDGPHHDLPDQMEKDHRKDTICYFSGLPLVRCKTDSAIATPIESSSVAVQRVAEGKTLQAILIETIGRYLANDHSRYEPRRLPLAERERRLFSDVLRAEGLGPKDLDQHLGRMTQILQKVKQATEDDWAQLDHDIVSFSQRCVAVPAPATADEVAARISEEEELRLAMGGNELPKLRSKGPLSLSFEMALDGLKGELLEGGWEMGEVQFESGQSGIRATLDIRRYEDGRSVQLRSRILKLSGVGAHIDFEGVAVEVATLFVMYAARNILRSAR